MNKNNCLFYDKIHESCLNKYNPTIKSGFGNCRKNICPELKSELKEDKKVNKDKKSKTEKKKKVKKQKKLI